MRSKKAGFVLMELVVAAGILGMILVCLAVSLNGFRILNHYYLTKQSCIEAAQAQIESIEITGKPVSDDIFKRLWPKVNISIEQTPCSGQWQSLKLVKVKAQSDSSGRRIEVELSRYVLNQEN